jgi:hypothetical protein
MALRMRPASIAGMFYVKVNGHVVAETALENENAAVGVRFGAAHLTPEYHAFRELIQEYTLATCSPRPVSSEALEDAKAAYQNLEIELVNAAM